MSVVYEAFNLMLSSIEKLEYRKLSASNDGTSGEHSSQNNSGNHREGGWQLSPASYCDKYAGHAGSTIGKSLCGPTYTLSLSFIITMGVLLIIEHSLHILEKNCEDTPFEAVVHVVFKEMTCLGCLTFLTILINLGGASSSQEYLDWHDSIGHADFVVFIMSVCYVLQASTHMMLSRFKEKRWTRASNAEVASLLTDFNEENFTGIMRWLPLSTLRDQLEYKIFLSVFCQKFSIRKIEFNFAGYLSESFKRYIISLLQDNLYMRLLFGTSIGLNVIRMQLIMPEIDASCDGVCQATRSLAFFAFCGWLLVFLVLVMCFFARLYQIRLMRCANVLTIHDYRTFLMNEEATEVSKLKRGPRRHSTSLTNADLKKTISKLNATKDDEHFLEARKSMTESLRTLASSLLGLLAGRRRRTSSDADDDDEKVSDDGENDGDDDNDDNDDDGNNSDEDEDEFDIEGQSSQAGNSGKAGNRNSIFSQQYANKESPKQLKRGILSQLSFSPSGYTNSSTSGTKGKGKPSFIAMLNVTRAAQVYATDSPSANGARSRRTTRTSAVATQSAASQVSMDKIADFSTIYLFGKPALFFTAVQVVMFFNCVYLTFWCTNFIMLPSETPSRVMWHVLLALPIIMLTPLLGNLIEASSMLQALSDLRPDVIGKVIEDDESVKRACNYLREKLINRLEHYSEGGSREKHKVLIGELVVECNKDGTANNCVSKRGFRYMLARLDLHFTDKTFKEVMSFIDRDQNNQLSVDELYRFVYPTEAFQEEIVGRDRKISMIKNNPTDERKGSVILRRLSVLKSTLQQAAMALPLPLFGHANSANSVLPKVSESADSHEAAAAEPGSDSGSCSSSLQTPVEVSSISLPAVAGAGLLTNTDTSNTMSSSRPSVAVASRPSVAVASRPIVAVGSRPIVAVASRPSVAVGSRPSVAVGFGGSPPATSTLEAMREKHKQQQANACKEGGEEDEAEEEEFEDEEEDEVAEEGDDEKEKHGGIVKPKPAFPTQENYDAGVAAAADAGADDAAAAADDDDDDDDDVDPVYECDDDDFKSVEEGERETAAFSEESSFSAAIKDAPATADAVLVPAPGGSNLQPFLSDGSEHQFDPGSLNRESTSGEKMNPTNSLEMSKTAAEEPGSWLGQRVSVTNDVPSNEQLENEQQMMPPFRQSPIQPIPQHSPTQSSRQSSPVAFDAHSRDAQYQVQTAPSPEVFDTNIRSDPIIALYSSAYIAAPMQSSPLLTRSKAMSVDLLLKEVAGDYRVNKDGSPNPSRGKGYGRRTVDSGPSPIRGPGRERFHSAGEGAEMGQGSGNRAGATKPSSRPGSGMDHPYPHRYASAAVTPALPARHTSFVAEVLTAEEKHIRDEYLSTLTLSDYDHTQDL